MSKKKQFGFRSSFGGYNKSEVNAYISKIAQDISKQNEEWEMERGQFQREIHRSISFFDIAGLCGRSQRQTAPGLYNVFLDRAPRHNACLEFLRIHAR
jgi:DivIVA domain-containing protein